MRVVVGYSLLQIIETSLNIFVYTLKSDLFQYNEHNYNTQTYIYLTNKSKNARHKKHTLIMLGSVVYITNNDKL